VAIRPDQVAERGLSGNGVTMTHQVVHGSRRTVATIPIAGLGRVRHAHCSFADRQL
jgi:hypothetical protein